MSIGLPRRGSRVTALSREGTSTCRDASRSEWSPLWRSPARRVGPGPDPGDRRPAPKLEVKSFVKGEPSRRSSPARPTSSSSGRPGAGRARRQHPPSHRASEEAPGRHLHRRQRLGAGSGQVKPFVEEMGDKMDYRVAMDAVPEGQGGGKARWPSPGWRPPARTASRPRSSSPGRQDRLDRPSDGDGRAPREDRRRHLGPERQRPPRVARSRNRPQGE